jgi:hypothetical protein
MLPIFKSAIQELMLLQTKWATLLNPLLSNPLSKGRVIRSVSLSTGDNTINHGLGRAPQGWLVIRQYNAYGGLYDKQDNNQYPELTLVLNASADTSVDLLVY